MQYVTGYLMMENIMFEIRVYYHDVLRYSIVADWGKVQELLNSGFNVQVNEVQGHGIRSEGWRSLSSFQVNGEDSVVIHHDDEIAEHKQAELRSDLVAQMLMYY